MNRDEHGRGKKAGGDEELASARSRRQTIAFFLHPDFDASIEAIPSCVPRNEEPHHSPISAGAHIAMKIAASHAAGRA